MENSKTIQENIRDFYRVELEYALASEMTIVRVQGKEVNLGQAPVLILDISPGGLRFLSHLKLPSNPSILLSFSAQILGESLTINGFIVRFKKIDNEAVDLYEYGVNFQINHSSQSALYKLLNELSLKLRKTPLVQNCNFIKVDCINYFRQLKHKGLIGN